MSQALFHGVFQSKPEQQFFAPGRINLIGEHIDYCGGLVMPMAIDRGTSAWAGHHDLPQLEIFSERFQERVTLDFTQTRPEGHWSDFARGVIAGLQSKYQLSGLRLYVSSNIEAGGLSSSASFSLIIAHALLWAAGVEVTSDQELLGLAKLCQSVEHDYIGVKCGIMDQASVALGGTLLLDCESLSYQRLPQLPQGYEFVVMDTAHPRTLASSGYNQRVEEVGELQKILTPYRPVKHLCEYSLAELPELLQQIMDKTLRKRLTHIVSEHARVEQARDALNERDVRRFGALMLESHVSLRDDYQVTGEALDLIVELSEAQKGCLGARMTGAGFGGCALALIESDSLARHNAFVSEKFEATTGIQPNLFSVAPMAAAGKI